MKLTKLSLGLLFISSMAVTAVQASTLNPVAGKAVSVLKDTKGNIVISGNTSLVAPTVNQLPRIYSYYETIYYGSYQGNSPGWNITHNVNGVPVEGYIQIGISTSTPFRMQFADGYFAFETDGVAGQLYRMYRGAFNRNPDLAGFGYWIKAMDVNGVSLAGVAANFMQTSEYAAVYGTNLSNEAFLTRLYAIILKRAPDSAGYAYWMAALNGGAARNGVLASFTEGSEFKTRILPDIKRGMKYIPF